LSRKRKIVTTEADDLENVRPDSNEVLDRIDLVNRNLANMRQDIAAIVRDTISQVLRERKKYVEVGYR
jgi:gamma-glutamyl phosphate reductase